MSNKGLSTKPRNGETARVDVRPDVTEAQFVALHFAEVPAVGVEHGLASNQNDAWEIGLKSSYIGRCEFPSHKLTVCSNEEVWKRHLGRRTANLRASSLKV